MASPQAAMRSEAANPAVALLRLRRLLREARELAGLTQAEAAAAVGYSPSNVLRIESGQSRATIPAVRALLEVYQAQHRLEDAELLARAAKGTSWTSGYIEVFSEGDRACRNLEPSATAIDYVALFLLPELLQTEEYAQGTVQGLRRPAASPELASHYVQAVIRRQQLLDDPPVLRFWLDESVLLRGMDNAMRGRQLDHLLKLATHPKITIRVVPLSAVVYTNGSFTLLTLDDPPETLLWVDDLYGGGLIRQEGPGEIKWRRNLLDRWGNHALPDAALSDVVDHIGSTYAA